MYSAFGAVLPILFGWELAFRTVRFGLDLFLYDLLLDLVDQEVPVHGSGELVEDESKSENGSEDNGDH